MHLSPATTPPHMATLVFLTGVSAAVMNMFLPSLPSMTEYFQTEYRVMQLSVALFLGLNGVLQIFVGPLSDRYGRRPVLLGGFLIFIFASLGCAYSKDITTFLIFRGLQAGVVVAMVLSRAIIRDLFARDQAASMIGYVTMGMAVIPMIGPAIGGYLDQQFGWQANFWVFFLMGCIGFWLIWSDLGETNTTKSASFRQQLADYPELLKSPRFWGYSFAAMFSAGAFFSYLGGAPFIGSEIFGLTPEILGIYFGAPAFGYIVGNYISARKAVQLGINKLIFIGSAALVVGIGASLLIFLAGYGTVNTFFGLMTFVGLGNGMVLPNAIAGTISVRPQLAGTASGLGGAMLIGGGAALSALAGSLVGPTSGPYPLLIIQLVVSILALVAIILVVMRERRILAKSEV